MAQTKDAATARQQSRPPADAQLRALLGPAWGRYQTALKGLAALGLEPEFYRYNPSGGWALRFQIDHITGCALYLAKSLTGLVAIGSRLEAALEANPQQEQLRRLVLATPRKGKVRWLKLPLRTQEDVRRFLSLMETKLQALQTPKNAVSHKPRRRTTAAATGRKKADTPPRRSTARRSSRG